MKETNDAALSDVRQAIERGTAKVSLRDLEKKGYRQVKVLKAGDIDKLVHQAVLSVLAKRGHKLVDESEREKFEQEAKAEYQKLLKARNTAQGDNTELSSKLQSYKEKAKEIAKERDELKEKVGKQRDKLLDLETRRQEAEARALQFEKQAKDERHRSEKANDGLKDEREKLEAEIERKLEKERRRLRDEKEELQSLQNQGAKEFKAERTALEDKVERSREDADRRVKEAEEKAKERIRELKAEKAELEDEKKAMYEKNMAGQQKLVQTYERQIADLRREKEDAVRDAANSEDLADAQASVARAKAQHAALTTQVKTLEKEKADAETEVERLRAELAEERLGAKAGNVKMEQMLAGLAEMIQSRPAQADTSALGGDLEKMFDKFSNSMSERLSRRMVDDKGEVIDADQAAAAALTGMMLDEAAGKQMETNLEKVEVVGTKTKGDVKSKLARLRSLKGGK